MYRMALSFMVRPIQGSEFDTWLPSKGGPPAIRPISVAKHGGWAGHQVDFSKLKKCIHSLFRELGIPIEDHWAGTTVDVSTPSFPELVRRLSRYREAGMFYPAKGTLFIEPIEDVSRPFEWFYLKVPHAPQRFRNAPNESGQMLGFECRADAADQKRHAMLAAGLSVVVSERFKEICSDSSGVEFLWLKDIGHFQASQWYLPIARLPLGARIDHAWFDPTKRASSRKPCHRYRVGVRSFKKVEFRDGVTFESAGLDAMASLFPTEDSREYLQVIAPYMALRGFLPAADFAYLWNEAGGERHLCISRRVRDRLLSNQVLRIEECVPVLVVDDPPKETEILDGRVEVPLPLLSGDALVNATTEAARSYLEHLRHPKSSRCANLEMALVALRAAKEKEPQRFRNSPDAGELALATRSLATGLPAAWEKVLQTANGFGFSLGDSFEVTRARDLPNEHDELQRAACSGRKDFPNTLLHITTGSSGDWHALDLSRLTPQGDCPVWQFDHETLLHMHEWGSVGAFLEELLLKTFAE